jgi:hypothetical protein
MAKIAGRLLSLYSLFLVGSIMACPSGVTFPGYSAGARSWSSMVIVFEADHFTKGRGAASLAGVYP